MEYISAGRGERTLVLLHGFCETSSIWKNQLPILSQHFHLLIPDLPGFGKSALKTPYLTMEYYAEAILQMLDQERLYDAGIVGHSMGGYVALAFAEAAPERINKLTLLHSTPHCDSDQRKINRDRTIEFLKKRGIESFATSFVPPLFRIETRKLFEEDIKQIQQELLESDVESLIAATAAMRDRPDRTNVLENSALPCQMIAGENDSALPMVIFSELHKKYPHIHLSPVADCGHMGMIEQPGQITKLIRDFHLNT